jgi:hypothetical protein
MCSIGKDVLYRCLVTPIWIRNFAGSDLNGSV